MKVENPYNLCLFTRHQQTNIPSMLVCLLDINKQIYPTMLVCLLDISKQIYFQC